MAETTIQWATYTFNSWSGCTKIAPGCAHCYAEINYSVKMRGVKWGPNGTRVKTSDSYWREPLKWNRKAACLGTFDCANGDHADCCPQKDRPRVFCASLADVFEDWDGPILDHKGNQLCRTPHGWDFGRNEEAAIITEAEHWTTLDDLRRDLFALIDATPNLDWLLLTKRPENILRMWPNRFLCPAPHPAGGNIETRDRPNVWLGTSFSDQATADKVLPELLKCRDLAPVLFASAEPLLGEVNLAVPWSGERKLPTIQVDLAITGGESGPNARPCNVAWHRSIRDQCRAADVACFIKQLGAYVVTDGTQKAGEWWPDQKAMHEDEGQLFRQHLRDSHGGDMDEWPLDLRVREYPATKQEEPTP